MHWSEDGREGELKLWCLEGGKCERIRRGGEESVGEGKAGVLDKKLLVRCEKKIKRHVWKKVCGKRGEGKEGG